jgi:hypothetical protein
MTGTERKIKPHLPMSLILQRLPPLEKGNRKKRNAGLPALTVEDIPRSPECKEAEALP